MGLNLKNNGTFSHCWLLCVEEHFYLFLPLTLITLQTFKRFKRSYGILIGLFLLGFVIRYISYTSLYLPHIDSATPWMYWYQFIYYPTYNRLDGLLAGVSIAAIYRFLPQTWSYISRWGNILIVLGLAILTGAYFLCENQMTFNASIFGFPLIALGYGLIVAGAVSTKSFLYQWSSQATYFLATLSYAIYLTHKGVIHMTHKILSGFKIDDNLMLFICMITCVGFAWLMHTTVEKPFMRLRSRIIRKKPANKNVTAPEPAK
ncbi:acyltransferase family protein [Niabella sp. 22666]|uniref:acyltransferase family protein n=1 Tax=Niabella sp. 22666 TaxID=3453954 RepID=UPI003F831ABF